MSLRGGASPVSALKQSAASCHWSLAGVGAHDVAPLGRQGHPRRVRREPIGNLGERHRPLPSEEPEPAHRRRPRRLDGDRAVHRAGIVQVGERGADLAHHAQHGGNVVGAGAREPRADRLARRSSAADSRGRDGSPDTPSSSGTSSARRDGCGARARAPPPRATGCAADRARSRARASDRARRRSPGSADAGPRLLRRPSSSPAEAANPRGARGARGSRAARRRRHGAGAACQDLRGSARRGGSLSQVSERSGSGQGARSQS